MMPSGGSDFARSIGSPVASLVMTCGACPAQWEGALEDGQVVYVRFRHGQLTVGFGRNVREAVDRSELVYEEAGNRGDMEQAEMLRLTGLVLGGGVEITGEDDWWGEE